MSRKYVASIMDRHYIGDGVFIYNCNHTVIGEIDEKTKILKDRNGNEYLPMLSPELMMSEIPYSYTNTMELNRIKEVMGNDKTLRDSIKEYEYLCKKNVYYVGKRTDGHPYCVTFNMDSIKETAENVSTEKQSSKEETETEREVVEDDLPKGIEQLILDVVNGKYSLKELRKIREQLKEGIEELEQAVDTIELQIEATEKGESSTTLPKDEEETPAAEEKEEEIDGFIPPIDMEGLFKKVTKTLIAQDEPARRVITEITRKEMDSRKKKEGILLTGPTGVGKTELMRLIAKYLDKPFYKIDSTQLTIPGYIGKDIEEVLWDLYEQCGEDLEKTEKAVLFFDEIDKKGSSKKSDVSGRGVLNVLLPFIEGSTYDATSDTKHKSKKVKINTANMTVILGGAFTDVYKNLVQKNEIGFSGEVTNKPRYKKATIEDFVEKGLMTDEFMGRVMVIRLNDLDVSAIKRIMLESDESALKIQEEIFHKLGVKITFTNNYLSEIAQNAYNKKTGARGLNSIIDETTWMAFNEVFCNRGKYEEVILTEETVKDPAAYQLIKRKRK